MFAKRLIMNIGSNKLSIRYFWYCRGIAVQYNPIRRGCLKPPRMLQCYKDKMFHNMCVNKTPDVIIWITITNNLSNLPKTFLALVTTPKKNCNLKTPVFTNKTESTFLTFFTRLIGSDIAKKRSQKLFQISFCPICKTPALIFLHCPNEAIGKCWAEAKNGWLLINNFKI